MVKTLEMISLQAGEVLAYQDDEAEKIFVLEKGKLGSKLLPEATRRDQEAILATDPLYNWNDTGVILAGDSLLMGRYLESLVALEASDVLVMPLTKAELLQQFQASPKSALSFGRSLARRVMEANTSLSGAQRAVTKLEQELEGFYLTFADIVKQIEDDGEGDELVLDAIKDAKRSKTYTTGQRLRDSGEENALVMTRVVEAYEMTGKQHKLKKGEALCRKGDPGNSMFIVTKGKLGVVIDGDKVGEINQGETVGEIAVLLGATNQARTADLIAEVNSSVAIIPGDQFEKLAMVQPAMLLQIIDALAHRIENNFALISDREAKERKSIEKYLGKADLKLEEDFRDLGAKVDELIEEYELTDLLRAYDKLERGAERIAKLKEDFSHWLEQA